MAYPSCTYKPRAQIIHLLLFSNLTCVQISVFGVEESQMMRERRQNEERKYTPHTELANQIVYFSLA